ncbi:MAG: pentapeptide repeat-containing protein [Chloroflexota bacterium]
MRTTDIEVSNIYKEYSDFYKISGGLTLVIIGIWIGSLVFTDGYATNVYTELLGVAATIAVLDQISQWRDRQQLKKRLFREAKGQSNEIAKTAIDWMRDEGWLLLQHRTPLLRDRDLSHAQLAGTNLIEANLSDSTLIHTNLQNSYMQKANLANASMQFVYLFRAYANLTNFSNASLFGADLHGTELWSAKFINCDLQFSNLAEAKMQKANLSGSNLKNAFLHRANLEDIIFDEETILPNGDTWYPEYDLEMFTNPHHPQFWKPPYLNADWDIQSLNGDRIPIWIDYLRNDLGYD